MLPYTSFVPGRRKANKKNDSHWRAFFRAVCNGARRGLSGASDREELKACLRTAPTEPLR